jgi:hypothetical protein
MEDEAKFLLTVDIREGYDVVIERMLHKALELTYGNRTHTASMLKTSIRTVRNHIIKFGNGEQVFLNCIDCGIPVRRTLACAEYGKCFQCLNFK